VVKDLPKVTVNLAAQDHTLRLDAGSWKTSCQTETLHIPAIQNSQESTTLSGATLIDCVDKTRRCVSEDRPALNGAHLVLRDGTLILEATDGHRLASITTLSEPNNLLQLLNDSETDSDDLDVMLPPKAVKELWRLRKALRTGPLNIGSEGSRLTLSAGPLTMSMHIDTNVRFPDTTRILDRALAEQGHVIRAHSEVLKGLLRRAAATKPPDNRIKLTCEPGVLTVTTPEFSETMPVEGEGHWALGVGINVHYLQDALKTVESVLTTFKIEDMETPVVILDDVRDGVVQLVMPMIDASTRNDKKNDTRS